jgi:hypothetical protein
VCHSHLAEHGEATTSIPRYAYIEIGKSLEMSTVYRCEFTVSGSALYGKPYIEAAKDTWRLFKDRGMSLSSVVFSDP